MIRRLWRAEGTRSSPGPSCIVMDGATVAGSNPLRPVGGTVRTCTCAHGRAEPLTVARRGVPRRPLTTCRGTIRRFWLIVYR